MNVEGGIWNEHFFNTTKLGVLAIILVTLAVIIIYIGSQGLNWLQSLILLSLWFIASVLATRFIIFEEKFYYHMYQELKEHEITSPAIFWDIASIKDTDEGAILTYSDAKIAIIVKVERDTITGKTADFKETHYDAISDFYREVAINRYGFVQMNIMEQAGKDPRLNELSKIIYKSDNENIRKLMEMEVGHIKNITHKSLYESDYFLFYTSDVTRVDNIIGDITECLFKLLDGAYVSYCILSSKDIIELVKELYGVNYFNSTQASLQMFNRHTAAITNPFNIKGILWNDGEDQELTAAEINKVRNLTNAMIRETVKSQDVSFKNSVYRKKEKKLVGIDFSTLSQSDVELANNRNRQQRQTMQNIKQTGASNIQPRQVNDQARQVIQNDIDDEEIIDI